MNHNTPPHLRLMPQAVYDRAKRLRQEYKADPQKVRRHQEEVSSLLKFAKLSEASFGDHWQWIDNKLRAGKWRMRDLIRACKVIKMMPQFGLHPSLVKKVQIATIVGNPKHLEANAWLERVRSKLQKLNRRVQEDIIKQNGWANAQMFQLTLPQGYRPFPAFLVCPSTMMRANLQMGGPTMVFALMGMISQLPKTIKSTKRTAIIDRIKQTDLRKPPSSLPCFDRIRKASKTEKDEVSMVDVVQCLAHAYWDVGDHGMYAFFYRSLRGVGIEAVCEYDFDWSNTNGTNVLDGEGRELRIHTRIPPTGRKKAAR